MSYSNSWIIPLAVCCVWPLVVHGALVYINKYGSRIDWSSIRWPWRKEQ